LITAGVQKIVEVNAEDIWKIP